MSLNIHISYLSISKFIEEEKKDNENDESGLESVIEIEEPDLENISQSSTLKKIIKQDEDDKNEPEHVSVLDKTTENCNAAQINDIDVRKVVIESDASDKASPAIEQNEDNEENPKSTSDIIKIPQNSIHRTKTPDTDEPVAKKRRLAASEFLELSDSNSIDTNIEFNKSANKIPQTISGDIKTYLGHMQGLFSKDKTTDSCFKAVS